MTLQPEIQSISTGSPSSTLIIERGTLGMLDGLTQIFSHYRTFYKQPEDLPGCRAFIRDRLMNMESVIFVAQSPDAQDMPHGIVGFIQLYETYSSLSLMPSWILNDLYVEPEWRGQRIAEGLIQAAKDWVHERGDWGLSLETHRDNLVAQRLYEKNHFHPDHEFLRFHYKNPRAT